MPVRFAPLVQIAVNAGEREVAKLVGAAVFHRDDVLDLKPRDERLHLGQLAILTTKARPLTHLPPRPLVHYEARRLRAFA